MALCGSHAILFAQAAWPTSLVSTNSTGTASASGGSGGPRISTDGRHVIFSSGATDLLPAGSVHGEIYVKDLLTGDVKPIDVNHSGTAGANGSASNYSISGNGQYVVFESFASDLTSVPVNGNGDIFVRDLQAGTTTLVSINRQGTAGGRGGESYEPQISADGRFVIFTSYATDLVENYTAGDQGLFIRDLLAGTTTLVVSGVNCNIIVNKQQVGVHPADSRCEVRDYGPLISADGHYLAFTTKTPLASNDDGNISCYLRDLYTGTYSLISVNYAGATATGSSGALGISADGRFVLFVSDASDIAPQQSSKFYSGAYNYYVRDMVKEKTALVTISGDGTSDARNDGGAGVTIQYGAMSADGRFVVFVTRAINLTPDKLNSDFQDIFVRDMVAGTTKLVSANAWGTASGNRQSWPPRISAHGRFVVFLSRASDLVYNDNNDPPGSFGCEDIFVRDIQLGVTTLASMNRFGTNSGNQCAYFNSYDISGDGHRVVFASAASDLVANDTNNASDVFLTTVPTQFGQLQFSAPLFRANEGDGSATITVTRTGGSEGSVSVDYTTSGGTASSRSNYSPAVGTLHLGPGETSKSFKILITDDRIANGDKTVNLVLLNPSGGVTLGSQSTATLTLVDNDATTSAVNPIDDSRFYVRQHYLDFLNREPDAPGLQFWANEIDQCGANAQCREVKRINVSAAFYLSIEFQQTGFLVYRMYEAAFARAPTYAEFLTDTQAISQGVVVGTSGWEAQLELNKQMFANAFVDRASFKSTYEAKTVAEYYNALIANTGVTPSEDLLNDFRNGKETRASFFRKMAEDPTFSAKQFNPAFVLMQYFGYLRRNPNDAPDSDFSGYNFWLNKLNQFGGNFQAAEMVKAFIVSSEYRSRFGP